MIAAAVGFPLVFQAVEHRDAVENFEAAVADRAAVYSAQEEMVDQLHSAEAALTADYPLYVAVASTLTDGTVADPAARAAVLSAAAAYARTDLALNGAGAFVAERPALYDALALEQLAPAESVPVSEFTTEELTSQAAVLVADTKLTRNYIELVRDVTDRIAAAAVAVAGSADAAIASAAAKGITLSWEKAPTETAAVVAAAAALAQGDVPALALSDRAGLVGAYIAAVNAAAAAQQVVLDQEAEAARQTAAAEAERQAAAQRQQNSTGGSKGNSSPRGSSGGQPSKNTNGSTGSIPQGGGRPGGGTNETNGGCWTSNGVGGTMPCGR